MTVQEIMQRIFEIEDACIREHRTMTRMEYTEMAQLENELQDKEIRR